MVATPRAFPRTGWVEVMNWIPPSWMDEERANDAGNNVQVRSLMLALRCTLLPFPSHSHRRIKSAS